MSSGFADPSSKFATKPLDAEGETEAEAAPWFLPADPDEVASPAPLLRAGWGSLLDAAGWRAAEAAQAADLAELAFEFGRLSERVAAAGQGAVQRLALEEAASLSWWSGDRVTADRLALWLSYRIGAVEEGGDGPIRIAWAARRLAAPASGPGRGLTEALAAPQADAGTGASRAAVQRNLDVLVDRGLIREVTGQGRFRVWAVRF